MSERSEKFAEAGVRISAAAAGGWLSTVLGPEAGAATAETISEIGTNTVGFLMARRRDRVEKTLTAASDEAARRIDDGEEVDPEFVEGDEAGVLFEAVVDAAAQAFDERKCAVIANVYAAAAFEPGISPSDALLYVKRIREASWRQLVVLQYLLDDRRSEERFQIAQRDGRRNVTEPRRRPAALMAELAELGGTLELIGSGVPGGSVQNPQNIFGGEQVASTSVLEMTGTAVGRRISDLGGLADLVTDEELDRLAAELGELPEPQ